MSESRQANQAKWFGLVQKYELSGMSKKVFCEVEQINVGTFHYWYKKYKVEQKEEPGFISLQPRRVAGRIYIRYGNGLEVDLPTDTNIEQLQYLISLGRC